VLVVVCGVLTAAPLAVRGGEPGRARRWLAALRWWRRDATAAERSLELLVADLQRLEQEFRRTEAAMVPYRTARLQALSLAYDDTLLLCCRLLDVPEPARPPWTPVTRLQVEAELALAGLDW
jgi:hypothetical protein